MSFLPFTLAFTIPASAWMGIRFGGAWLLLTPFVVFVVTPVLDGVVSIDTANLSDASEPGGWRRALHLALLLAWLPIQATMLSVALWRALSLGWLATCAMAVVAGIASGAGAITVAHELMHRTDRWSRAIAELLMVSVTYPHFCIEHVSGHHKHVATPDDPASARRDEVVYGFWLRSIVGGLRSALRIERQRTAHRGIAALSPRNRTFRHLCEIVALYALAYLVAEAKGLLFVALQSLIAVLLLETINYVEHYGLRREKTTRGYEAVRATHAWSSSHRASNYYLFRLPRHADHHQFARRPYWALRHLDDAPQLPSGYGTMVLVALVPPLWRATMHPRLDRLNAPGPSS